MVSSQACCPTTTGLHHIRDDIGAPIGCTSAFFVFGLLLIALGSAAIRAAGPAPRAR